VERGHRDRKSETKERRQPIALSPREEGERRNDCDSGEAGENREAREETRALEASALGRDARNENEQQVKRIDVDSRDKSQHTKHTLSHRAQMSVNDPRS